MYGGGADACRDCREMNENARMNGDRIDPDTCYVNRRAGPGGCVNPQPELRLATAQMFSLWTATDGAVIAIGMDGVPVGRDLRQAEAAADALGIPWDESTLEQFRVIQEEWLRADRRKRKEAETAARAKARR